MVRCGSFGSTAPSGSGGLSVSRKRRLGRRAEMTVPIIIAIVLGLIVAAVLTYMFVDKSRQAQKLNDCASLGDGAVCRTSDGCPSGTRASITPCKAPDSEGNIPKTYNSVCCVPDY